MDGGDLSATSSPTPTASNTPSPTPTASQGGGGAPISVNATFQYDGDGRRVSQTINGVTTYFVGNYYEVTGGVVTKYYYAGAQRVAMRANGTLYFLLGDHLGSTSLTTDASGNVLSEMRYTPWGEVRYNAGVTPTDYGFTGQMSYAGEFGLLYYNARWVDPYIGRFAQADTIVPPGVQGLDRYSYVFNNPLRYTDPTGHKNCEEDGYNCVDERWNLIKRIEGKFKVEIRGSWAISDLQNFEAVLNKFANQMGGVEEFNEMIVASLKNKNINSENVVALRAKDDPRCNGSGGCWIDGNLIFNDRAFTSQYQQSRGAERRPISLGFDPLTQDGLNLSIQATMAHEMMHMYADANPISVSDYVLRVSNFWAFSGSFKVDSATTVQLGINAAEESMASAGGIYIVTNGAPYPLYQDQMDFISWLFNH